MHQGCFLESELLERRLDVCRVEVLCRDDRQVGGLPVRVGHRLHGPVICRVGRALDDHILVFVGKAPCEIARGLRVRAVATCDIPRGLRSGAGRFRALPLGQRVVGCIQRRLGTGCRRIGAAVRSHSARRGILGVFLRAIALAGEHLRIGLSGPLLRILLIGVGAACPGNRLVLLIQGIRSALSRLPCLRRGCVLRCNRGVFGCNGSVLRRNRDVPRRLRSGPCSLRQSLCSLGACARGFRTGPGGLRCGLVLIGRVARGFCPGTGRD